MFWEGWAETNASNGRFRGLHDGGVDKQGQNYQHVGWMCCECVVMRALKSVVS